MAGAPKTAEIKKMLAAFNTIPRLTAMTSACLLRLVDWKHIAAEGFDIEIHKEPLPTNLVFHDGLADTFYPAPHSCSYCPYPSGKYCAAADWEKQARAEYEKDLYDPERVKAREVDRTKTDFARFVLEEWLAFGYSCGTMGGRKGGLLCPQAVNFRWFIFCWRRAV